MTAATSTVESFTRFSQWVGFGNHGVNCPTDAQWFDESAWETGVEDEPGFKQTWHTCPNRHGFPGRTPYAFRDSETKARTADQRACPASMPAMMRSMPTRNCARSS
ncbi:hypothetical protein GCM10009680_43190 [Streptomyces yatensis]|uniref:Uncharacterized protein n=1 Tax=Streptomyces yatensis TaxID=155177 RepID=A0ABN2I468_9ACTN